MKKLVHSVKSKRSEEGVKFRSQKSEVGIQNERLEG